MKLRTLAATSAILLLAAPAFAQQKPEYRLLREACESDATKLCADVPRGGGRVLTCLKSQPDKLTPGCREALPHVEQLMLESGKPAK